MITASHLYNYLTCPHRVTMDAFADPATRGEPSPFVQLLWERGSLFEAETIRMLGLPFVDLSKLRGDEKEAATRAAIERGEGLIYNGRLSADGLLGEPDLLRREGTTAAALARYVAVDIKSGAGYEGAGGNGGEGGEEEGKPKAHYGVQIALYTDLLRRLDRSAGDYGFIWDVHGREVRYDLHAPLGVRDPERTLWSVYLETRQAVERALSAPEGRGETTPAAAAVCKQCVWRQPCLAELKARGDLTLLPELGRAKRDVLVRQFPTVANLANANIDRFVTKNGRKTEFPGVGPGTLRKFQARARLCSAKKADAAPYLTASVDFIPKPKTEVYFDIETDPMRDLCYLHGFIVRENGDAATEQFVGIYAEDVTPEAEHDAFRAAWTFLQQHRESLVVYYSKYERTAYRKLANRFPDVCRLEEVEALFALPRSLDLYLDVIRSKSEWPTMDYSVKTLAKYLGFQWRDTDPSGASSIEWFNRWAETRDPALKQRLLDYNEDDCVAMRVVLDAVRGMRVREG